MTDTDNRRTLLARRGALAARACRVAGLVVILLPLLAWLPVGTGGGVLRPWATVEPGAGRMLALVAFAGLLPVLALTLALFSAARCFSGFARPETAEEGQPRALAAAGRWLMLSGVLGLVLPALLLPVLLEGGPAGMHGAQGLATASGGAHVALLSGGVLWAFGRLWGSSREAARAAGR